MKRVRARAFGLFLFVTAAVVAGLVASPSVAYAPPGDPGDPYARVVGHIIVSGVNGEEPSDLVAFKWGVNRGTAGNAKPDLLVVVKPIDGASPALFQDAINGTMLKYVWVRMGSGAAEQSQVKYCFAVASVLTVRSFDHGAADDTLLEEVTIDFQKGAEVVNGQATGFDWLRGTPWVSIGRC